MFVTRFWFFLIATACGLVLAVTYLLQDSMNVGLRKNVDDLVRADFSQVQSSFKLASRGHLDRLSEVTASEPLREAMAPLAQASVLAPPPPEAPASPAAAAAQGGSPSLTEEQIRRQRADVRTALGDLLKAHFQDVRRPFLLAVNRWGEVLAHEGAFPPPEADARDFGVLGFPSVRAVLRGYERDDVWLVRIKGKMFVYQIAGRPVVHQGKYLGAVILGRPIDDDLARELRSEGDLTAQIFFFAGDQVIGKAVRTASPAAGAAAEPEVDPKVVLAAVAENAKDWEEYVRKGERPVVAVGSGFRGVFAPLRGQAAEAGVGFMIVRPLVAVASPWTVLRAATKKSLSAVPVVEIVGVCMAAFVLAMLWIHLEHGRPLRFFQRQAVILKGKENERFNAYLFRGRYRRIAIDVNAAIDKTVKAIAGRPGSPDVASILGPASSGLKLGSYPIAGLDDGPPPEPAEAPKVADLSILGGAQRAAPPPAPPARQAPPPHSPPPPAPPARQAHAPHHAPPPGSHGSGPRHSPDRHPPSPPPAVPFNPFGSGPITAPRQPPAAPPIGPRPMPPPAAAKPAMHEPESIEAYQVDEEIGEAADEPTRIQLAPAELLEAAQSTFDPLDRGEREIRRLFESFRATKMECGEAVGGLTLEKFKASIEKNRGAIMQKQKCRDVQFSVYVKAGKAALKATPVT